MTARVHKTIRALGSRLLIAAVAAALLTVVSQQVLSPKTLAHNVIETASIVQEPTIVGIADSNLYNQSQADIDRTLDTLQAMGVQNVRIVIPWAGVQPFNLPFYNWANVDRMVNAAAARNMGVLAVLNSTPVWASDRYLSGHPDPSDFAEFAGLVADRYNGDIAAYEVWNEPNAITFWNPVDPVAYTQLLQAGYTAIKAEDPDAVVIGGVVASLFTAGNVTINPQDFIAQMYDAGAKGYFDAISFHPYHFSLEFSEGNNHPLSAEQQVEEMRQVMVEHGDGALKIWATEYGMPTAQTSTGEVITEEQQAAFIEDFLQAWQNVDGAGPAFIYTFRDSYSGDPDIQKNFGIFYTDWTPKLAAQVIAQFAGGQLPERPDRPLIDAALAITRAIVNATSRVIHAGVQLFAAAVDVTVRFIAGLVDLGVRVIQGVAVAVGRVIDAIGDRVGPEDAASATTTALRIPAVTGRNTTKVAVAAEPDTTSVSASEPESGGIAGLTGTKPAAAARDSDSNNSTQSEATATAEPEPVSETVDEATDTDNATAPKRDPEPASPADDTKTAKDDDAAGAGDQESQKANA
jgi:polysaccharide biosynthesis protein PslG